MMVDRVAVVILLISDKDTPLLRFGRGLVHDFSLFSIVINRVTI